MAALLGLIGALGCGPSSASAPVRADEPRQNEPDDRPPDDQPPGESPTFSATAAFDLTVNKCVAQHAVNGLSVQKLVRFGDTPVALGWFSSSGYPDAPDSTVKVSAMDRTSCFGWTPSYGPLSLVRAGEPARLEFDFGGSGSGRQRAVVLRDDQYGSVQVLFIAEDTWRLGPHWRSGADPVRVAGATRDALLAPAFHEVMLATCPNDLGPGPHFEKCYRAFRVQVPELLFLEDQMRLIQSPTEARAWYEERLEALRKSAQSSPSPACPLERAGAAVETYYLSRSLGQTIAESLGAADKVMGRRQIGASTCQQLARKYVVPGLDDGDEDFGFDEGTTPDGTYVMPRVHAWAEIRRALEAADRTNCKEAKFCQIEIGVSMNRSGEEYSKGPIAVPPGFGK